MTESINQFIENYKDGVPVSIKTSTLVSLVVASVFAAGLSALLIKYIKKV